MASQRGLLLHGTMSVLALVAVTLSATRIVTCSAAATSLRANFYQSSCPDVETIIFSVMKEIFKSGKGNSKSNDNDVGKNVAPDLLRLHFHDCFVKGCDGSVLLDVPNSEKTAPPNARLEGFAFVDQIKEALEASCPGRVSCADILAYAARDGVRLTGGSGWTVLAGRRDGFHSIAAEAVANLPGPEMSVDELTATFAKQGLSQEDMVTLSGAHTIGDVACHHIDNRLYGPAGVDPALPPKFAEKLQKICPEPHLLLDTVDMDQQSPIKFDTKYYENLVVQKSVLSSDQVIYDDARTRPVVEQLLKKDVFFARFAQAMIKMGNNEVLTGSNGEVRLNCRKVNS